MNVIFGKNRNLEVAHDTDEVHETMTETVQEQKKERTRREYAKKGERNQKMMCFRVDNEVLEWLESQPNKGRYINNLIVEDMNKTTNNNIKHR